MDNKDDYDMPEWEQRFYDPNNATDAENRRAVRHCFLAIALFAICGLIVATLELYYRFASP